MKVKIGTNKKMFDYDVSDGSTINDVLEIARNEAEIPGRIITNVGGIAVDKDYVLSDGDVVLLRLAEAMYGANTSDISSLIGKGVKDIIRESSLELNLPSGEKFDVECNGKKIGFLYKVKLGDRVEFIKKAGRKL